MTNTLLNIMISFNKEYPINFNLKYPLIGRYNHDMYYDGNPWVLTTVALCRMLNKINKIKDLKHSFSEKPSFMAKTIINTLMDIHSKNSIKFDNGFSEQIDKKTGEFIGAVDLTWNYAECLQYILESEKVSS